MNKKEREIITIVLCDVETLDLKKDSPDNPYFRDLIKGNLNDLRGGRYTFKKQLKLFIEHVKCFRG